MYPLGEYEAACTAVDNTFAYVSKSAHGQPMKRLLPSPPSSLLHPCNRQANSMGKGAFITTFTSDSVEAAAKGNPDQFTVAKSEGVLASEEMLRLILAACS